MIISICDDEKCVSDKLEKVIHNILFNKNILFEIYKFYNPEKLLNTNKDFDLIFLDIGMPKINGLLLARKIREKNSSCKIVFISNYKEFVQEGYKVKAFRYLYKPFKINEIEETLTSIIKEINDTIGITISCEKEKKFFRFRDIFAIESLGDGSAIHYIDGVYKTYKSLSYIKKRIDSRFFQCHRSYIINLGSINAIKYSESIVYLKNNLKFNIAIRKKGKLKEIYHTFIINESNYL